MNLPQKQLLLHNNDRRLTDRYLSNLDCETPSHAQPIVNSGYNAPIKDLGF